MPAEDSYPVVLITGASSGIGLALARLLSSRPYRVVATARESSLARIGDESFAKSDRFLLRPLDVNDAEQRRALVAEVYDRWGRIDVLVNNAGICFRSVVEHMDENDELLQLKTNFLSPVELTKLVLQRMRQRRAGRIINVSSVGGMMAMPTMGSYSASKFALEGASEALWYELRPWGIKVVLVQPGFINSNSFRHVYTGSCAESPERAAEEYISYYRNMNSFIERLMSRAIATSESVAKKVLWAIEHPNPPLRVPATIDAYFFSLLRRLLPRRIYHWLLYKNLPGVSNWGKNNEDIK